MNSHPYVTRSLELHLFFGRIMKEHALFLKAGFTPPTPTLPTKRSFLNSYLSDINCPIL